ncbi:DUF2269 family protein [Maricaulis sp. CAU 1757]
MVELLRFAHVLGACVLLGTGAGIAFFMLISVRSRDPALIAHVAGIVVLADWLFTATAAIAQPVTGVLLARASGWSLTEPWLMASTALYLLIGALWLPVVVLQMRMRALAQTAAATGSNLPRAHDRLFRLWVACGIPAFAAILAILWLMLNRPMLG